MNYRHGKPALIGAIALLGASSCCWAGSERMLMSMTEEKMNRMNLIYVRFQGADGSALESNQLKQMSIREPDCDSGHRLELVTDYKIGYGLDKKVGIYLSPQAWQDKSLCFSIPNIGKVEQRLTPDTHSGRQFSLQFAP